MRQKTSESKLTAEQIKALEQQKKREQSYSLTKYDIALITATAILFSLPGYNAEEPSISHSITWKVITTLLLSRAYNTSTTLNYGLLDMSLHSIINAGGCYFALNILKMISDIISPDATMGTPAAEPTQAIPWNETDLGNTSLSMQ